jgi:hypothetical protein
MAKRNTDNLGILIPLSQPLINGNEPPCQTRQMWSLAKRKTDEYTTMKGNLINSIMDSTAHRNRSKYWSLTEEHTKHDIGPQPGHMSTLDDSKPYHLRTPANLPITDGHNLDSTIIQGTNQDLIIGKYNRHVGIVGIWAKSTMHIFLTSNNA